MNKVIFTGRLAANPQIGDFEKDGETRKYAKYALVVPRDYTKEENDVFLCVTFRQRNVKFTEKYFKQGMRVLVEGQMRTGSYNNSEGQKIHTCQLIVERQEFADGKKNTSNEPINEPADTEYHTDEDGYMYMPDDMDEDLMPFK